MPTTSSDRTTPEEPHPRGTPLTPRDAFTLFTEYVLSGAFEILDRVCANDVVVEWPFNPPGQPRRLQGRAEFRALALAGRAALPVRFDEFRSVVLHELTDADLLLAEYDLAGTVVSTGRSAVSSFALLLRVRDGKVTHLREYQDVLAMADALGPTP